MQLPLPDPETLFEDLLQDLPPETIAMAREFKAFVRARKVKTPQQQPASAKRTSPSHVSRPPPASPS